MSRLAIACTALGLLLCCAAARGDCPPEVRIGDGEDLDGVVERARALRAAGCNRSTRKLTEMLLPLVEAEHGARSRRLAEVLELLAEAQFWLGERNDTAVARARKALEIRVGNPGESADALARSHLILGSLLSGKPREDRAEDSLRLAEAMKQYETARALWAESSGPRSRPVADVLPWIAELIDDWGADGRREGLLLPWTAPLFEPGTPERGDVERAVAWLNERLPDPGRGRLAVGVVEDDLALTVALQAVALAREGGTETEEHAHALNILGNLLNRRQLYDEAQVVFDECLDVRLVVSGPGHPQTVRALHNHAEALMLVGDFERARRDLEAAYRARQAWGVSATTAEALGRLLSLTGDLQAAMAFYRDALPGLLETYGRSHWRYVEGLIRLGESYQLLGETGQAERHYRQALASLEQSVAPEDRHLAQVQARLGKLLVGHDREAARRLLQAVLEAEGDDGPRREDEAIALDGLAALAAAGSDHETALKRRRAAAEILGSFQGIHPALADALLAVAEEELALGRVGDEIGPDAVEAARGLFSGRADELNCPMQGFAENTRGVSRLPVLAG